MIKAIDFAPLFDAHVPTRRVTENPGTQPVHIVKKSSNRCLFTASITMIMATPLSHSSDVNHWLCRPILGNPVLMKIFCFFPPEKNGMLRHGLLPWRSNGVAPRAVSDRIDQMLRNCPGNGLGCAVSEKKLLAREAQTALQRYDAKYSDVCDVLLGLAPASIAKSLPHVKTAACGAGHWKTHRNSSPRHAYERRSIADLRYARRSSNAIMIVGVARHAEHPGITERPAHRDRYPTVRNPEFPGGTENNAKNSRFVRSATSRSVAMLRCAIRRVGSIR